MDAKGQLKLWIDADHSKNKPNGCCSQQKVVEQYMICEIFKIFDHMQDDQSNPCEYTSFLRKLEAQ